MDLIHRSAALFEKVIVSILRNENKQPLFNIAERIEMLSEAVAEYPNVEVDSFDGLLVHYARSRGAKVIVRGIRAISDYEYELQMAHMNRMLEPRIDMVFLMANEKYSFISSRLVKEVFRLGGDISGLVPPAVEARLRKKVRGNTQ